MDKENESLNFGHRKWIKAVEYLGVKRSTIYKDRLRSFAIHDGQNGRVRIHVDDLDRVFGRDAVKRNKR